MEDYVKRYVSKDGTHRITIYYDEYSENPRDMTDEPLHCEDWNRDYSIMNKHERETHSSSCADLLRYFLRNYGDNKKIVKILKNNYKEKFHNYYENAAYYDFSRRGWVIVTWNPAHKYSSFESHHVPHWEEECILESSCYDFDIYNFVDDLSDESVAEFANKCLTDKIKLVSYRFGYHGRISFNDELRPHSDGIAWLEKDEFLKYSGNKEEYWNSKSLSEIEWLLDELKAWGDNEVYHYRVEKRATFHVRKECTSEDRDILECDTEEWEDVDSCSGFYGDINYCFEYAVENTPFKKEDFSEVR